MTVFYQKRPTEALAHLAWCLLVAIRLAQQEGKACPGLQIHLFIMQWLSKALKRKLFPRSVAPDIAWLLEQGKRYGFGAKLYQKVEYIWRASSGELAQQNALFRFTWFIETLKTMGWLDFLLSPQEWRSYWKASTTARAVYTPRADLHSSFSETGKLIKPIVIRLSGDTTGIFPLLEQCCFNAELLPVEEGFSVLRLLPDKD